MKNKPPRLYPGEVNQIGQLFKILTATKNLIGEEIDRLETLCANPTFPAWDYVWQIRGIRAATGHLSDILVEVKL
jgi:hypothetical protein